MYCKSSPVLCYVIVIQYSGVNMTRQKSMIPWLVCDVEVVIAMITRSVFSNQEQFNVVWRRIKRNNLTQDISQTPCQMCDHTNK